MKLVVLLVLIFIHNTAFSVERPFLLDLEAGPVWNTYNKLAVPNDTGTRFSLTDALDVESKMVFRVKLAYKIAQKHSLSLLYAPLSLKGTGILPSNVAFNGDVFLKGDDVNAVYKFNSYRLTYAYTWVDNDAIQFNIGFTAKIRDAKIAISNNTISSVKKNTGFVPLLHLDLLWRISERLNFKADLDAMAAPQGRAEDLFLGFLFKAYPFMSFKLGYRIVEGGADVKEVYNFACLQYLTTGFIFEF